MTMVQKKLNKCVLTDFFQERDVTPRGWFQIFLECSPQFFEKKEWSNLIPNIFSFHFLGGKQKKHQLAIVMQLL